MTLLAVALTLMMGWLPVPAPPAMSPAGLGPFRLGMTRDEAQRIAPCHLRRPPGRYAINDLSCSNFKLLTSKMALRLTFRDDKLGMIGLSRTGYSELRARQEIDVVLRSLAGDFGELVSPQMAAQTITAEAAFANLKRNLTYASTARLTVTPVKEVPGLHISAWFTLSRGSAPRGGMSDDWYEGKPPTVSGSQFDVVTHSVSVTIRSDSF
jgi:hypothetical protein